MRMSTSAGSTPQCSQQPLPVSPKAPMECASSRYKYLCGNQIYGAFVLNRRVHLHAIDATSARWRGGVGVPSLDSVSGAALSPRNDFVKNYRVHPTHWLISTQKATAALHSVESSSKWARRHLCGNQNFTARSTPSTRRPLNADSTKTPSTR